MGSQCVPPMYERGYEPGLPKMGVKLALRPGQLAVMGKEGSSEGSSLTPAHGVLFSESYRGDHILTFFERYFSAHL